MRLVRCLALTLAVLPVHAAAQDMTTAQDLRIMPLGDSITEARAPQRSYRYWLHQELEAAGRAFDFVGSNHGVCAAEANPCLPASESHSLLPFDADHDGYWGARTSHIRGNIAFLAAAADPDVVLLHLGFNDLAGGGSTADRIGQAVQDLDAIIDTLRQVNPRVRVLLALLPPTSHGVAGPRIGPFNQALTGLASLASSPDSPVIVVDQFNGFDPAADTYDGIHPNDHGERKLARRWATALAQPHATHSTVVSQHGGPDALEVVIAGGAPSHHYALLFTIDRRNRIAPGHGPVLGLYIEPFEIQFHVLLGAPLLGTLSPLGSKVLIVHPGLLPATVFGWTMYGLSLTFAPNDFAYSGTSPVIEFVFANSPFTAP